MKQILLLSKENIELALEEVLAVSQAKKFEQDTNIVILETKKDLTNIAFTKKIFKHLFSCKIKDLEKKIGNYNWQKIYKKNFRVRRIGKLKLNERDIASLIWHKLKKPKVNLDNPKTNIFFLITKKNVHCGLLIHENKEKFMDRRPHLRKGFHPTSMQPKLARALVNISRIKKGQTLLDPFCGTGGILIEAGLVGCKLRGNDITKKMLEMTKLNLKSFKLRAKLTQKDALQLKETADAVVTDLPYGKGSHSSLETKQLYEKFLQKSYDLLKPGKYLIAVFPRKIKFKSKLKFIKDIEFYMHGSLTRHIILAKKSKK